VNAHRLVVEPIKSIQTTGDIYTDWDIDQLAETLLRVVDE
jgi:hypothetical protein